MAARNDTLARALALLNSGQAAQAEAMLRRGLSQGDAGAEHLLGLALAQQRKGEQAEFFLRAAVRDNPGRAEFHSGLGNFLAMNQRHGEAADAFRAALACDAAHAPGHAGLALTLMRTHDFEGAEGAAREAQKHQPGAFQTYVNLASVLTQSGRAAEALQLLRAARERFPGIVPIQTAIMVTQNYVPGLAAEALAAESRLLGPMLGTAVAAGKSLRFANSVDPDRRLRIAYISGDLRLHSVAFFLEPALEARDRGRFDVRCYSTGHRADAVTARLRGLCDGWVEATDLSGDALVERMRTDRIDIAVDLAGHTTGGRVMALARREAPVQVTYLGYPATTGVPGIDYRLVDSLTDPEGSEAMATERLARIDPCFVCYRAPANAPRVSASPQAAAGHVTFGSFNSMPKMSPEVLDAWASVMKSVPGSRLLIKNRAMADANMRRRVGAALGSRGIDEARVELAPPLGSVAEHLGAYGRVDIGLDTFPYNGTTTTCEALWMGVPVVTLAGEAHAGRVGLSLLSAAGLGRLAAASVNEYTSIAAGLAGDAAALQELRAGLRSRVAASPLCDAAGFARGLEDAYREMWRAWCGGQSGAVR